jgi:hypothetical protein
MLLAVAHLAPRDAPPAAVVGLGVLKSAAARTRPTPSGSSGKPSKGLRPDLAAFVDRWEKDRDVDALADAGDLYAGDTEAEMAAIEAGTHPLQRGPRRRG